MAKRLKSVESFGAAFAGHLQRRIVSTSARQSAPPTLSTTVDLPPTTATAPGTAGRDFSEVPGPKTLPLLGNYMQIRGRKHDLHNVFTELRDVYGDIYTFKIPSRSPMVVLNDLDALETLFRNEGWNPIRTQKNAYIWYLEQIKSPLGFVFSNGEQWRRVRSAISKQTAPRCAANLVPQLSKISEEFASLVERERDPSNKVLHDMLKYIQLFTFEGISSILLNRGHGMLTNEPSEIGLRFKEAAFDYMRDMMNFLYALPLYKIFPTKPYVNFDTSVKNLLSVSKELVDAKVKEMCAAMDEGREVEQVGFLDQWLLEGKLTQAELLPIIGELLSAGIDTTANTAAFLLHEVAKNPEIQHRLHKEVTDVAGTSSPTAKDISKLTFTKNCIKETLRLYPISHMFRGIPEDMVLCGYRIPKGVTVVIPLHTLGRDERNFPDPLTFKPDRWDRETSTHRPFAYIPFGFGPRSCYGKRLAEYELILMLSKLVQNFYLSTDQDSLKEIKSIVLQPGVPVEIKFEDRM